MQKLWLVVVAASVVVGVSTVVESVVVGVISVVVGSIVIVVMEVSSVGDGHERSGKSSCRFTLAAAPQPSRALPGCLFPTYLLVLASGDSVFESNECSHGTNAGKRWL